MYVKCSRPDKFKRSVRDEGKKISDISRATGSLFFKNMLTDSAVQKYALSTPDKRESKIIKDIVLSAAVRSESISATSGEMCLNMSSIMMSSIEKKMNIEKISETVKSNSKRLERSDMDNLFKSFFKNSPVERDIVSKIFDNISFQYPVFIERTNHVDSSVSISSGFNFDINVDKDYFSGGSWKRLDVKVFVIDGFIESVGEIHHLLEKSSGTKEPVVIFARNFSEDVLSTLKYNFKRGTLDILPVSVGFDENTLNILNDISVCCNSELVSSLKGDLISKSIKEEPSEVHRVLASSSGITISNKNKIEKLSSHIKYLTEKRDLSISSPDLYDIYSKRIRSMISGKTEIKIGTDLYHKNIKIIEKLDNIMRICKSYIASGVIYKKDFLGACEILDESTEENFPYPASAVIIAAINSNSLLNSLSSVGHVVYEDRQ